MDIGREEEGGMERGKGEGGRKGRERRRRGGETEGERNMKRSPMMV